MSTRAVIYFYPIAGAGAQVRARGSDVRAHETRIKASGLELRTVERRAAESHGRILPFPFIHSRFFCFLIMARGANADIFRAFLSVCLRVCEGVWVIVRRSRA